MTKFKIGDNVFIRSSGRPTKVIGTIPHLELYYLLGEGFSHFNGHELEPVTSKQQGTDPEPPTMQPELSKCSLAVMLWATHEVNDVKLQLRHFQGCKYWSMTGTRKGAPYTFSLEKTKKEAFDSCVKLFLPPMTSNEIRELNSITSTIVAFRECKTNEINSESDSESE